MVSPCLLAAPGLVDTARIGDGTVSPGGVACRRAVDHGGLALGSLHLGGQVERDALIDELCDLQHDLGKYILVPVSFLPANAPAAEIRAALRRALFETRSSRDRVLSARELWRAFQATVGDSLDPFPTYAALREAVERALAWGEVTGELDRVAVTSDLAAVQPAVRAVIEEVMRER